MRLLNFFFRLTIALFVFLLLFFIQKNEALAVSCGTGSYSYVVWNCVNNPDTRQLECVRGPNGGGSASCSNFNTAATTCGASDCGFCGFQDQTCGGVGANCTVSHSTWDDPKCTVAEMQWYTGGCSCSAGATPPPPTSNPTPTPDPCLGRGTCSPAGTERCTANNEAQTCATNGCWGAPSSCSPNTCTYTNPPTNTKVSCLAGCTEGNERCNGQTTIQRCVNNLWSNVGGCNGCSGNPPAACAFEPGSIIKVGCYASACSTPTPAPGGGGPATCPLCVNNSCSSQNNPNPGSQCGTDCNACLTC